MRRIRWLLWPAAIAFGLGAERAQFQWRDPGLWIPDVLVGWTFIACGLIAWDKRPESRSGPLMSATGFAWFLPNFAGVEGALGLAAANMLFWHRGPLINLVLTYPEGRASSWLTRSAVGLGYAAAVLYPVSHSDPATMGLATILVVAGVETYRRSIGPARRAHRIAAWATVAISALFASEAIARIASPNVVPASTLLVVYEATLCAIGLGLTIALVRVPWERASVTDLVVELGETRSGTLREQLANALGDPSLAVGYWLPEQERFVDAEGRAVDLPDPSSERSITTIERDGQPVAILVHDRAVLADRGLVEAVSSAAKLSASNARLQAGLRARQADVRASRHRILDAGDEERRRLERRLRVGALRRLEDLGATLQDASRSVDGETATQIAQAEDRLVKTQEDLRRLARGLHPHELTELGLAGALASLVADAPLAVKLDIEEEPFPPDVQACAYFVCSEALANIVKHARAPRATVSVRRDGDHVAVMVEDDGAGGADPMGSGLRGLADRVETLGGTVMIESPPERGTLISATIPVSPSAR